MNLASDDELSAAQAVQDISAAMLKAAGACLQMHGNDPSAPIILTAGVCLFIDRINKEIDPTFKQRLLLQLAKR